MIDPTKSTADPGSGVDGEGPVTKTGYTPRPLTVKTVREVRGSATLIRNVYTSLDGTKLYIGFRDGREFELHADEVRAAIDEAQR